MRALLKSGDKPLPGVETAYQDGLVNKVDE